MKRALTFPRAAFLVLALLAATLLSLRSACDLWFTHLGGVATAATHAPLQHDIDAAVDCCASASDLNTAAPLQTAIVGPQASQGIAAAVLIAVVAGGAILAPPLHWLRTAPSGSQSFYLRSARILR